MAKIDLQARRHSASHVLAAAVLQMFPEAKLGTGPDTETGFYYDFQLPRPLIPEDLPILEEKMLEIKKQALPFERYEEEVGKAKEFLGGIGQTFKAELVEKFEAQQGITSVSFYKNGDLFVDLCEGPHVDDTSQIGEIKLTHFSGAYWQGDENREQMTRIYGLCFASPKDMKRHLKMLEEAKARDHRKLGKELDLFCFSEKVGPGLPLFTPKGTFIKEALQQKVESICRKYGFEKVHTPHFAKIDLYETSGHAQKFSGELFGVEGHYRTKYCVKPVQCPHHTQIYASQMRSYRDLPIRYMESEKQYRDEKPGQIGGLNRVIAITVEDGHTFCRPDQIETECKNLVHIIREFYASVGLWGNHWVSLSLRDPESPENYIGSDENWKKAEDFLEKICDDEGLDAKKMLGEAALYGPKIDFMFRDAIGNERQLATVQLDFATPERFKLEYIDEHREKQTPVMIHRAILGSYERFMAILIEHFAGHFPLWLAPVQCHLLPVADAHLAYAEELLEKIKAAGGRAEILSPSESLGKRIRESQMQKVPLSIVLGDKEVESGKLPVRKCGEKQQEELSVEEFLERIQ